ncbi:hypothetical protein AMELA_G00001610 [Ameiurus melas]|uniref:Uncharacterized protein n=1 Tax=Ameiurus melas TaxID=219545 RepID=A0A7J6BE53_AMEME|nr:hypothetical protein AMELA_G00001610 [Ameiurus melas]
MLYSLQRFIIYDLDWIYELNWHSYRSSPVHGHKTCKTNTKLCKQERLEEQDSKHFRNTYPVSLHSLTLLTLLTRLI